MRKKSKTKDHKKFWAGLLVGGIAATAAAYFGPALLKHEGSPRERVQGDLPRQEKQTRNPPEAPKPKLPSAAKPEAGPAIFRRPATAASLLARLGLGESYPGSMVWKKTDLLGWNAFGSTTASRATQSTSRDVENTVTCLLESQQEERVEVLRLIANVFKVKDQAETMAKFRSLATVVLTETGWPAPRQFTDAISAGQGLKAETPDARFELGKTSLASGLRWELTIHRK